MAWLVHWVRSTELSSASFGGRYGIHSRYELPGYNMENLIPEHSKQRI
jgi:hypothetical protein